MKTTLSAIFLIITTLSAMGQVNFSTNQNVAYLYTRTATSTFPPPLPPGLPFSYSEAMISDTAVGSGRAYIGVLTRTGLSFPVPIPVQKQSIFGWSASKDSIFSSHSYNITADVSNLRIQGSRLGGNGTIVLDTSTTISGGLAVVNGNMGVGTIEPSASLDIVGTLQYSDGNESEGYVLTTDSQGNSTWQNPDLQRNYTATEASALTLVDGKMIYVTSTNGTFLTVGFYGVESGSWGKFTLTP